MNRFRNAMKILGDVSDRMYERNKKVDQMTNELLRRGYDINLTEAKKVARILVDQAEVTWK